VATAPAHRTAALPSDNSKKAAGAARSPGTTVTAAVEPETARFRRVLGHFCTGITIITTADDDGPAGFACQSFAAVSLDPPLVLFCPHQSSVTWRRIERAGHFCASVLGAGQDELAAAFGQAAGRAGRFEGVPWFRSAAGAPVLAGSLAWVAAAVEAVHEAGDHFVVLGRVTELGAGRGGQPLLFYRGALDSAVARPDAPPQRAVDALLTWPRPDDWI
jgi:3-hydroxy-9,10-secoandrosta-1,3,5(10)-triene-9,17-dione monooxygenase reductase component